MVCPSSTVFQDAEPRWFLLAFFCRNFPAARIIPHCRGWDFIFIPLQKKTRPLLETSPVQVVPKAAHPAPRAAGGVQVGRSQADELRLTLFASPSLATPLQASMSSTHSMATQPLQHLLHVAFSSPGTQGHQYLGFWSCFSERPPCSPPGAGAGGDIPPLAAGGFAAREPMTMGNCRVGAPLV